MKKLLPYLFSILFLLSCQQDKKHEVVEHEKKEEAHQKEKVKPKQPTSGVYLFVLGTIQDAGSPQLGCYRDCCRDLQSNPDPTRKIVSLGLIDYENQKKYLFEATPDFVSQWSSLNSFAGFDTNKVDGIFLTHAHIGHYTGLIFLGVESMNGDHVPVFTMPEMSKFLESNGPWSQLVKVGNIELKALTNSKEIILNNQISVEAIQVPHRDEYSETVGFKVQGPNKSFLFIPDINKWNLWETSIVEMIKEVDYAFLDGSFYDGEELPNRYMDEIPHPFISESMELFSALPEEEKSKVHFIHFNHTNPILIKDSEQREKVLQNGFQIAEFHQMIEL